MDCDNIIKGVIDALQSGGVIRNDNQIEDLRIRRIKTGYEPNVSVRLTDPVSEAFLSGLFGGLP